MTDPDDDDYDGDMDELRTRLDSLEESLEALHDKLDIVLAALDDRDNTTQTTTHINEGNWETIIWTGR